MMNEMNNVFLPLFRICLLKIKYSMEKIKEIVGIIWKSPYTMIISFSCSMSTFTNAYITATVTHFHKSIADDAGSFDSDSILIVGLVGTIVGSSISFFLNNRFGRLWALRALSSISFIGTLMMANAGDSTKFLAGRCVIGVAFGFSWVSNPLYITEAVPPELHGTLIAFEGLLISLGLSTSSVINEILKVQHAWRWAILLAGIPITAQLFMTLMLVDSPFWLYMQGKIREAEIAVRKSWPESDVAKEMRRVELLVNKAKDSEISLIKRFKLAFGDTKIRHLINKTFLILIIQQLSGLKYVNFFNMLIQSQRQGQNGNTVSSNLGYAGDIICLVFIEGLGANTLLMISTCGIALCLLTSTLVCFWLSQVSKEIVYQLYIFFYFVGYGSLPKVIAAEVYGSPYRDMGATATAIFFWLMNSISTVTFRIVVLRYSECKIVTVLTFIAILSCFIMRAYVVRI